MPVLQDEKGNSRDSYKKLRRLGVMMNLDHFVKCSLCGQLIDEKQTYMLEVTFSKDGSDVDVKVPICERCCEDVEEDLSNDE